MRRIALFLFAAALPAATVFRVDPVPVMTTAGTVQTGGYPALFAVAGATVQICTDAACATPATTYTGASGATACPVSAQITLPGSFLCTNTTGAQGQFGVWIQGGTYYYTVTTPNGSKYGPLPFSVGSTSGSPPNCLNPISYGADTTGATDSSAAFNAALSAAVTNGGGCVYVAPGSYKISSSVIVPEHVELYGSQSSSCLLPGTSPIAMVVITGASSTESLGGAGRQSVHDLCFDSSAIAGGGANAVTNIKIVGPSANVSVSNINAKRSQYGLYIDASGASVWNPSIRNFHAISNTGMYAGNAGMEPNLVYSLIVDGWFAYNDGVGFSYSQAMLLDGCISCIVSNFQANDMAGRDGIVLFRHDEAPVVTNSVVTHAGNGIWVKLSGETVPQWVTISNTNIDQATIQSVRIDSGANYTQVVGDQITNQGSGSVVVNIPAATSGVKIQDNTIMQFPTADAVVASATATNFSVTGNYVENGGGGASRGIVLGASNNAFVVSNNVITTTGGSQAIVDPTPVNTNKVISGNTGYGLIASGVGGTIASAGTITPAFDTFTVSGTAAIATITPPAAFMGGCLHLLPQAGFTLATGGNIGKASTAVANQLMNVCWDGTNWWPSY